MYSDSVVESIHGQWVSQSYNGETRRYRYDRMGRLVGTASSVPGTGDCVTRSYAYDNRANRKARSTTPGVISDTDGTCVASTDPAATTTENHTYDSADRLVDPGVVYDAFGRTTALPTTDAGTPATLQNSYYVNDLVASQTLGTHRQSWTLDPGMRLRSFATQAQTAGVWSNASAKVNHYDGDDDESRWIVEDTSQGAQAPVTRNVESVDGSLAATTAATAAAGDVQLQLVNLHGDVAVTLASDLSVQSSRFFDEFGAPESGTASGTGKDRYGWLGGAQRSGEALGDVLLMGVRLYSPLLGRFLQTDPVPDGNASAYDYCNADPVNCTDLDGRWGWKKLFHAVARVSEYASWIPGPIGTAAAAVSSVSYYASGNRRKALEMGLTAAANLVGAGAGVRAGFRVARYAAKAGRIRRFASRASRVTRCNSFTPDTLVVAGDGTLVPIDQLAPGDDVATVDPATGDFVPKPVLDVITGYGTKHLIEVTVDTTTSDGTTTGVFTATDEHPVWVDGHGWVHADALTAGMRTSGTTGGISVVRLVHDLGWLSGQTVYNLNVGDAHTYLVADPTGTDTLVHNSSCPIFKHHVPNKRGVYVIHFKNGERYVGRSKYMHKRVHQHFARRGKFHGRGYSDISHIESYTHHTARYTRYQEQMWINHHRRSGLLLNRRNEWARFVR